MDLDFGNLNLDFGAVKPLPRIPEGEYLMRIVDWNIDKPKREESAAKGFNLRVKFAFVDSVWEQDGETHDISSIQPNDLIYVMPANPFAIVPLVCAVLGLDKENPKALQEHSIDITDKSAWIGEELMVRLYRKPAADGSGKTYLTPVSDAYMPVGF